MNNCNNNTNKIKKQIIIKIILIILNKKSVAKG